MKIKASNGFTLVEAMLSVVILLVIWLAAINAFILGQYSSSYAKHKMQAIYIAQQQIEMLRKSNYAAMASQSGTFNDVYLDTRVKATRVISMDTPTLVHGITADSSYRNVRVEIRWTEPLLGISKTVHEYCAGIISSESQVN